MSVRKHAVTSSAIVSFCQLYSPDVQWNGECRPPLNQLSIKQFVRANPASLAQNSGDFLNRSPSAEKVARSVCVSSFRAELLGMEKQV